MSTKDLGIKTLCGRPIMDVGQIEFLGAKYRVGFIRGGPVNDEPLGPVQGDIDLGGFVIYSGEGIVMNTVRTDKRVNIDIHVLLKDGSVETPKKVRRIKMDEYVVYFNNGKMYKMIAGKKGTYYLSDNCGIQCALSKYHDAQLVIPGGCSVEDF